MNVFATFIPLLLVIGLYALFLWLFYVLIKNAAKNGIKQAVKDPAVGDWLYRVIRGAAQDALREVQREAQAPSASPEAPSAEETPPSGR